MDTCDLYSLDSLFNEESSIWAAQDDFLVKGTRGGVDTIGGSPTESLVTDVLETIGGHQAGELSPSEEFPGWMSEKIPLSQWVDVLDIMPSDDDLTIVPLSLPKMESTSLETAAEELLDMLMVDSQIARQSPSPGEQQAADILALSPTYSMHPLSPSSPTPPSTPPLSPTSSYFSAASPQTMTTEELLWQFAEGLPTIFCSDDDDLQGPKSGHHQLADPEESLLASPVSVGSSCAISPCATSPVASSVASSVRAQIVAEPPQVGPVPRRYKVRSKVKAVPDPSVRKHKKRDQNKVAATRYRHKKRAQESELSSEQEKLEDRNKELNERCEAVEREIKYLKDLMTEVYRVKGELKILRK